MERVIEESVNIRTFVFTDPLSVGARPGQFVMIWLPGIGEFPMSLSLEYPGRKSSIVVKGMGEGSRILFDARKGEQIGIRGPYGTPFEISPETRKVLLVAGGTGIAPIISLAAFLKEQKKSFDPFLVLGAKTKREIPFLSKAKKLLGSERVFVTTDDGSLGFSGFAHEKVVELAKHSKFDLICACGPEAMLVELYKIAKKESIPVQFSLERIMKCGIAICGSCCIEDLVLCRDGPVLDNNKMKRILHEFGRSERDKTGKLVPK
ncbi:MAG: dihydroorotate dehydrogenase electron transfer subunit [Nitrososphaerales archaeon]